MPTLFIDNGGSTLKAIYSSEEKRKTDNSNSNASSAAVRDPAVVGAKRTQREDEPSCYDDDVNGDGDESFAEEVVVITAPNAIGIPNSGGNAGGPPTHAVGPALLTLPHYHQLVLRRPTDKGFIIDAPMQALLWTQCILEPLGIVSEKAIDLVLTCPLGCPNDASAALEALLLELFKFRSVTLVTPATVCMVGAEIARRKRRRQSADDACNGSNSSTNTDRNRTTSAASTPHSTSTPSPLTGIVVDCGFSGTTLTPFLAGRPVSWNALRIDVGGKLLTNRLKEMISFTQVDLTEDTWLCNAIKETCCFCAHSIAARNDADADGGGGNKNKEENDNNKAAVVRWGEVCKNNNAVLAHHHVAQEERHQEGQQLSSSSSSCASAASSPAAAFSTAMAAYAAWSRLSPLDRRRAVAAQRKAIRAVIKHRLRAAERAVAAAYKNFGSTIATATTDNPSSPPPSSSSPSSSSLLVPPALTTDDRELLASAIAATHQIFTATATPALGGGGGKRADSETDGAANAPFPFWFPPPVTSYVLPATPQTQPLGFVLPSNTPAELLCKAAAEREAALSNNNSSGSDGGNNEGTILVERSVYASGGEPALYLSLAKALLRRGGTSSGNNNSTKGGGRGGAPQQQHALPTPQSDWQYVRLGHEAFIVGETVFHPSLVGLKQCGLAEALRSGLWYDPRRAGTPLFGAPPDLKEALLRNIVLVGGTGAGMAGLAQRLEEEIRPVIMQQSSSSSSSPPFSITVCSDVFALSENNSIRRTPSAQKGRGMTAGGAGRGRKREAALATSNDGEGEKEEEDGDGERPSFLLTGALALFFGHSRKELMEVMQQTGHHASAVCTGASSDASAVANPSSGGGHSTRSKSSKEQQQPVWCGGASLFDPRCTIVTNGGKERVSRDAMQTAIGALR